MVKLKEAQIRTMVLAAIEKQKQVSPRPITPALDRPARSHSRARPACGRAPAEDVVAKLLPVACVLAAQSALQHGLPPLGLAPSAAQFGEMTAEAYRAKAWGARVPERESGMACAAELPPQNGATAAAFSRMRLTSVGERECVCGSHGERLSSVAKWS